MESTNYNEVWIADEHASCYELKDYSNEGKEGLRVYRNHPNEVCLQIRTFKSIIGPFGYKGKKRAMIANVDLTLEELRQIVRYAEKELV